MREQSVRARPRAGFQLTGPPRARQVGEGEGTQVDGRKVGRVDEHVGRIIGRLGVACAIGDGQPPSTRPLGHERVGDLEDEIAIGAIGALRKRRTNVDDAQPQAVAELHGRSPRVGKQEQQRMVSRAAPGRDARHQVDAEHVAPQPERGGRIDADQLDHHQRACMTRARPIFLDPVHHVAGGVSIAFVDRVEPLAATRAMLGQVGEQRSPMPPASAR